MARKNLSQNQEAQLGSCAYTQEVHFDTSCKCSAYYSFVLHSVNSWWSRLEGIRKKPSTLHEKGHVLLKQLLPLQKPDEDDPMYLQG